MRRHTITLCMIALNEESNILRINESIKDCFDQVILVDTGSTDKTVELAQSLGWQVEHFKWIQDFSAARNYAASFVKTDYWMWMDLDDELHNPEGFRVWRDTAMPLFDFWLAPYYYGFDPQGRPNCTFIRERVFKTELGFQFQSFIHEGVACKPGIKAAPIETWRINHRRTNEEMNQDRGRNLKILLERRNELDPRLHFYFGKELFDAGEVLDAAVQLKETIKMPGLEANDRILGIQYLVNALFKMNQFVDAIKYGLIGVQADPMRAELYCMIGDSYVAMKEPHKAVPFYKAAQGCVNQAQSGMSATFATAEAYEIYPKITLAKLYYSGAMFEKAIEELHGLDTPEANDLREHARLAIAKTTVKKATKESSDIVITTPPHQAYPWDEVIYQTKGLGGSETAAVEMSKHLAKITGRRVIIFQPRDNVFVAPSGVEYRPQSQMHDYFNEFKPALHIAWRHAARLTDAYSVVWSHDLTTPGGQCHENYDKYLCLSEFHRDFVQSMQNVPREKIRVTRNGLDPVRFKGLEVPKQFAKVIWPSSPDRGLEHAIFIMDLVRKELPDAELHCFYGFDNLYKYGLGEKADYLKGLLATRPWIKYHGNVDQTTLAKEFASSEVWLYPATFIETFCLSAIESLAANCWPVSRDIGALPCTLKEAKEKDMCDLLDLEPNESTYMTWANTVAEAIMLKKYRDISVDLDTMSWESVAQEWSKEFNLCQAPVMNGLKQNPQTLPVLESGLSSQIAIQSVLTYGPLKKIK